ncbi:TFIIB-type zinc ribbon-containing protein [Rhodopirellula baltica]
MPTAELTTEPELQEIACQSCGAALTGLAGMLATICPYCASPSVIQRPPSKNRPTPTFAIGFVVDQERATELVKQWIGRAHWFARSDFKRAAPNCTRGVYLPAYLYGAVADTQYSASIGENYTETETYTTTDSNGKQVTRTRTVTKTEWRSLTGQHSCYVLDVIVTASKGTDNDSLEAIEPFDLRALRRYSPSIITGWLAELPSRDQATCFQLAHGETIAKVGSQLKNFMPGDSHRNLEHRTQLSREVIDLVLLPIWCFAVRYDENQPPVQILVNGQTGRVGGSVPTSTTKIALVVGAVLLFIAFIVFLSAMQ